MMRGMPERFFRDVVDLGSVIRSAIASFAPDELAYLALTGKPELALRDRIAFQLHTSPQTTANRWTVSREYRRIDLAVLRENGLAAAVIEMKCAYSFDAVLAPQQERLRSALRGDLEKCRGSSFSAASDSYGLLAITHPLARVPTRLFGTVKYAPKINRLFDRREDMGAVATAATAFACEAFGNGARVLDLPVTAGSAFGIPVEVLWFVVEATRAS